MSTKLRASISATLLADIVFETHLGISTDPETQDLAGSWQTFLQKTDALSTRFHEIDRSMRGVRMRLRVANAQHNALLKRFNRALLDAVDGNRKSTLFTQFFGTHSISEIITFGTQRVVTESKRILAILQTAQTTTPDSKIAELAARFVGPFSTAIETLVRLNNERAEQLQKQTLLRIEKNQAVEDFNRALNSLEGALLQKFPADTARVGSYLKASQPVDNDSDASDEPAAPSTPSTPTNAPA